MTIAECAVVSFLIGIVVGCLCVSVFLILTGLMARWKL